MTPYSIVCTRTSTNLALTLAETKAYLKITTDHDDLLIANLIKSVSQSCESHTSLALLSQEWHAIYRGFPNSMLQLPKRPARKINEIELINYQGKASTYNTDLYKFDPENSELLFYMQPLSYLISIKFSAGFGESASDVPEEIRLIMCAHVAFLYENRGSIQGFPMSRYNDFKFFRI